MPTVVGADARHNSPPPRFVLASRPFLHDPSEVRLELPSGWSYWRTRREEVDSPNGQVLARAPAGTAIPEGWQVEAFKPTDLFADEAPLWFDASDAMAGTLLPTNDHPQCRYDPDFDLWSIDMGHRTYEGFKTRQEAIDGALELSREDWNRQVAWIKRRRGGRLDWGVPIPNWEPGYSVVP